MMIAAVTEGKEEEEDSTRLSSSIFFAHKSKTIACQRLFRVHTVVRVVVIVVVYTENHLIWPIGCNYAASSRQCWPGSSLQCLFRLGKHRSPFRSLSASVFNFDHRRRPLRFMLSP